MAEKIEITHRRMTEEGEAGFVDFVCQAMVCPELE